MDHELTPCTFELVGAHLGVQLIIEAEAEAEAGPSRICEVDAEI